VDRVEGEVGDFNVTLTKKPRYIIEDKCTGCATCVEYCPIEYPDPFNQGICNNKAVHVYFSQAIPLVSYIDESCVYLKEKKCRICESVCQADAIDFHQKPEKMEIKVAAIVLSPGIKPYDPEVKPEYGYRKLENVVTSMDFERLLSSTGPYEGEILRTSDKKHPNKIAWIQCVGSRRVTPGDNSYCSGVCCTYTQKQVILAKDHNAESDLAVFHNDIRSHGKDFERYYQRAVELPGVRFIRSYVSIVGEDPETKNVKLKYATTDQGVIEEEFEMVVLSVGLNPPANSEELAAKFGIDLNSQGFCEIDPASPTETSRPGIYISGAFQGPTDIPESVFSASGAGSRIGELLDYRRGNLARDREYPPERDVSGEAPRVGVFVCHCGANIGRVVNVPEVVEYCKTLPNVVHAQEQLFSCATNSAKEITDVTSEKGLNRVVVAACSPRTLEPLFRDTLREAGINQYYFEMANIREQNSWVHSREKEEATTKAKDITRKSVARAGHLEALQDFDLPVNKAALIIGGGVAGMNCALSIAKQGHEVHLVEKENDLGGKARNIHSTLDGLDVQEYLRGLIKQVYEHSLIHVYHNASITGSTGYVGNFVTSIESETGPKDIKHGAAIIAMGADLYTPQEYMFGEDERVVTHLELEELIASQDEKVAQAQNLVMIQCVGCRNEERNYCSRLCCSESVKNALRLKEINPELDITILFRDMRTYGFNEDYYRQASEKDIKFIRFEPEDPPQVEPGEAEDGRSVLKVSVTDFVLGGKLELDADMIALAAAVIPSEATKEVAGLFKVTLNPDGFFKEAHVKLRPVEFSSEGVYLCGLAHYPKFMQETINQARGAAGRALTLLSNDIVVASGSVCEVDENRCVSCGACITVCNYGAIDFHETAEGRKARVNPVLCKGDGLCNTKCATNAIQLLHFTDDEVMSEIDAAFPQDEQADTAGEFDAAVGDV
jgi:heterodisulfide reductase subunit A